MTSATSTTGIDAAGLTDVGRKRKENQDQFLIAELRRSLVVPASSLPLSAQARLEGAPFAQLFAVADGVGGAAGGERASYLAMNTLLQYSLNLLPWCLRHDQPQGDDLERALREAIDGCQARIDAEAERDPGRAGLSTTLTLAFVVWPQAWLVHLGDSRCYHLRQDQLTQCTADHTIAAELARNGAITESAVTRSRWRNVLSRSLGAGETEPNPSVQSVELEVGDTLLLCSDGLNKHVPDAELFKALREGQSAADTCAGLVDLTNERGGSDNVTCVVARFGPGDPPSLS